MDIRLKKVTRLPLDELWRDDGFTTISRGRDLSIDNIASLLRAGKVQFVVADVGAPPRWIPVEECYNFWKTEGKPHLAAPQGKVFLRDFPDEYCYFASEWNEPGVALPIVVCEKSH